jgi:hypothetical protein
MNEQLERQKEELHLSNTINCLDKEISANEEFIAGNKKTLKLLQEYMRNNPNLDPKEIAGVLMENEQSVDTALEYMKKKNLLERIKNSPIKELVVTSTVPVEEEKMIDKIKKERKEGKLTLEKTFDYAEKAKENPKYSADTKKIDEITRKLIGDEPFVNFGSMMEDPEIAQLFSDYSNVSKKYVGVSGEETPRAEALKISQAAKEIAARRKKDLTEDQINMLNKITKDIETAMQSRGLEGVLYPIN